MLLLDFLDVDNVVGRAVEDVVLSVDVVLCVEVAAFEELELRIDDEGTGPALLLLVLTCLVLVEVLLVVLAFLVLLDFLVVLLAFLVLDDGLLVVAGLAVLDLPVLVALLVLLALMLLDVLPVLDDLELECVELPGLMELEL